MAPSKKRSSKVKSYNLHKNLIIIPRYQTGSNLASSSLLTQKFFLPYKEED
ncbi:MAG: hypothetical protein MUO21_04240 [Nitrososphaeraceae archaeon]|nr:hypothetical protein [Nitrososphaeraceae archaeon]